MLPRSNRLLRPPNFLAPCYIMTGICPTAVVLSKFLAQFENSDRGQPLNLPRF